MKKNFTQYSHWVFDLDDTIYPQSAGLWQQISDRINQYIKCHLDIGIDDVKKLRAEFRRRDGGALQGLKRLGKVDEADFLRKVHDIDYSALRSDPELARLIAHLPGQKFIYTNADRAHAQRVIEKMGLSDLPFEIYDIEAANLIPKPKHESFERFFSQYNCIGENTIMFEDSANNLNTAKAFAITTVHVIATPITKPSYIDYQTTDLKTFLTKVAAS